MNERSIWQFMKRTLYALKRQYGAAVCVYKLRDADTDYRTGQKSIHRDIHKVRRAIMLPEEVSRQVEQGLAHLSTNKMFVSQAGFDLGKTTFIFDASDLPSGFTFELDDHILVEDEYHKVVEIDEFEYDSGWLVKTHRVEGADLSVVLEPHAESAMGISQVAEAD
jgi:hypothetical protein